MILSRKLIGGTTYVWKLKPLVLKQLQPELWLVLNFWTRKRLNRHFLLSAWEIQCLHHLVSYRRKNLKEKVLQEVSQWNPEIPTQVPEQFSNH